MSTTAAEVAARADETRRGFQRRLGTVRTLQGVSLASFVTFGVAVYRATSGEQIVTELMLLGLGAFVVGFVLLFFNLWFLKCPFCNGSIFRNEDNEFNFVWFVRRCRHCKERLS